MQSGNNCPEVCTSRVNTLQGIALRLPLRALLRIVLNVLRGREFAKIACGLTQSNFLNDVLMCYPATDQVSV